MTRHGEQYSTMEWQDKKAREERRGEERKEMATREDTDEETDEETDRDALATEHRR